MKMRVFWVTVLALIAYSYAAPISEEAALIQALSSAQGKDTVTLQALIDAATIQTWLTRAIAIAKKGVNLADKGLETYSELGLTDIKNKAQDVADGVQKAADAINTLSEDHSGSKAKIEENRATFLEELLKLMI